MRTPSPRSASLNSPVDARRQLSGLMSLCTTFAACTSATAATMAAAASTLSRGGKFATLPSGAFDSHCESDSPQRSIAVNTASLPSKCTPYKNVTRLLFWLRNLCRPTSRSTNARTASLRSPGGSGIRLIAAGLRTTVFRPSCSSYTPAYTAVPSEPRPNSSFSLYQTCRPAPLHPCLGAGSNESDPLRRLARINAEISSSSARSFSSAATTVECGAPFAFAVWTAVRIPLGSIFSVAATSSAATRICRRSLYAASKAAWPSFSILSSSSYIDSISPSSTSGKSAPGPARTMLSSSESKVLSSEESKVFSLSRDPVSPFSKLFVAFDDLVERPVDRRMRKASTVAFRSMDTGLWVVACTTSSA
mmetsp:Transcript_3433/g.15635  ORF Transcript_3433/g.15635 Transcript_3433/m.15635 type:complete len:363 (+) Transcript_3433:1938-3026(+)